MAADKPTPRKPIRLQTLQRPAEARQMAWIGLIRVFYRMHRRLEQTLGDVGITIPQFDVLATLRHGEGITQQELAERLLVTKGNVCGLLDRLEQTGWVDRRPDAKDRRANRLYLTAGGRAKLTRILPEHDAAVTRLLASLSDAEIKSFRSLMDKLEGGINDSEVGH